MIDQVGTGVPYLSSSGTLPAQIGDLMGDATDERRVGLVWQGNPRQTRDVVRSCPFGKLRPLFDLSGIRFLSLQHDPIGRAQLAASRLAARMPDVGKLLSDFSVTAAVLQRLDLSQKLDKEAYERELDKLERRLALSTRAPRFNKNSTTGT